MQLYNHLNNFIFYFIDANAYFINRVKIIYLGKENVNKGEHVVFINYWISC